MKKVYLENLNKLWINDHNIEATWAFGSAKDGNLREGSDIDIGILFKKKPIIDDLLELSASIQEIIGFDDIDLTVLNEASSILQFEAVKGRKLYCRDDSRCAEYVSLVAREYEDDIGMLEKVILYNDILF